MLSQASDNTSIKTGSLSFTEADILPYTQGLQGVNLWLNAITSNILYASLCLIVVLILMVRMGQAISAHLRFLTAMNMDKDHQTYWAQDESFFAKIKKHLLVAPLIHKRHNKEIQISNAIGIGTIPSRLHTLFLAFYVLSNVIYCCILDYHHQSRASLLAEARGRTGHLSVMNMLPLFIFSARNNPLIPLLGISFDTFNLFHRWVGRLAVVQALAHTFLWGVNNYEARGLDGLLVHLRGDLFLLYGLVGTTAMTVIVFQSVSFIRHAFYETFLHFHQFLAIASLVGILLHCESQKLPQRPLLYALIVLWGLERFVRLCRIFSRRGTKVQVEALEGGACRVTFDVRGKWTKRPGCHIYAYIPSMSLWMSHPFSVAWVDDHVPKELSPTTTSLAPVSPCSSTLCEEKTLTSSISNELEKDFLPLPKNARTSISCIMACRTGMTAALYRRARESPTGIISLSAFMEGPYGGLENPRSYGTVLFFAGGVGITHQINLLHDVVSAFADGTCVTRKAILVWSVRSIQQWDWARPWLEELSRMPLRGNRLKMLFYVTRATLTEERETIAKESVFSENIRFCRVDVKKVIEEEFRDRVGAMSISFCGPGRFADDVRAATRSMMGLGNVDFWEESFSW